MLWVVAYNFINYCSNVVQGTDKKSSKFSKYPSNSSLSKKIPDDPLILGLLRQVSPLTNVSYKCSNYISSQKSEIPSTIIL